MTRFVDRGAIVAAVVGAGMAVTMAISFLLVIPIEPIYWLLAVPAGLLIGYYANQRSDRGAGPWARILLNAAFAGLVTGLTMAALLLVVKGLFFFGDNGYPDFNRVDATTHQPIPPACDPGAGCVYARYLKIGDGPELAAAGITDAETFTTFYWGQQAASTATVLVMTLLGGLGGGALYGVFRPKAKPAPDSEVAPTGAPVAAAPVTTLDERIEGLRGIGFFADLAGSTADVRSVLEQRHAALFEGIPLAADDQLVEQVLASLDASRVWWRDLEADVDPANDVYVATIGEWSAISMGAFAPTGVTESWADDGASVTVSMVLDGVRRELHPEVQGDWIDLAILLPINEWIGRSGRRFEVVAAFDQTAVVLALSAAELRDLEQRGWRFASQAA